MLNRMHLESPNREAFELLTDALELIDRYRRSREVDTLNIARKRLDSAVAKDPGYFRASYFRAIVEDLAGRPAVAVEAFTQLLGQQPPFTEEVRYNLGVAEYHQYSHGALDRAIQHFARVIEASVDPALLLLSEAGLAQAHAMHIIPKDPRQPDRPEMALHFNEANRFAREALRKVSSQRGLLRFMAPKIEIDAIAEAEWAARNAVAMAGMYYSDYFPDTGKDGWMKTRIRALKDTVANLEKADKISPKNWANYCDMASANMRLGYYTRDLSYFEKAVQLLDDVIVTLRPEYAFAKYEKARILRLRSEFAEASELFRAVLEIPANERDVGDLRLNLELGRSGNSDASFP